MIRWGRSYLSHSIQLLHTPRKVLGKLPAGDSRPFVQHAKMIDVVDTTERLAALRELMKKHEADVYSMKISHSPLDTGC